MNTEQRLEDLFHGELDIEHVSHPTDAILVGHRWGSTEDEERETVAVHLATCDLCSARLKTLRADAIWQRRPEFLPDPLNLFVEGEKLGALRPQRHRPFAREAKAEPAAAVSLGGVMWKPVLVFSGAALAIGVTHLTLNRLLVPPVSPFATPVEITRWWLHLYWILVPVALFLGWRLVRAVRTRRGDDT